MFGLIYLVVPTSGKVRDPSYGTLLCDLVIVPTCMFWLVVHCTANSANCSVIEKLSAIVLLNNLHMGRRWQMLSQVQVFF